MRVYEVVGVSRFSGTSKKTGKPFSMTRLSLTYSDPADKNLIGCGVREVTPSDFVFKNSGYEPVVGDQITLVYDEGFDGKAVLRAIEVV